MKKELKIGILLFALTQMFRYLTPAPHFIVGLLLGVTLCFQIIGNLPEGIYGKLKARKRTLFRFTRKPAP